MADFTQIADKPTLYKAVDDERIKVEIGGSTLLPIIMNYNQKMRS